MAALSVLTQAVAKVSIQWNVTANQTGLPGIVSNNAFLKNLTYALGVGAGQINEIYGSILGIGASSSQTLTVSAITDVVNNATAVFARIKMYCFYLMTATDVINGVTGTAASGITIGNAAVHPFGLGLTGTTPAITLANGQGIMFWANDATGLISTVSLLDQLKIANNDAGITAQVVALLFGGAT